MCKDKFILNIWGHQKGFAGVICYSNVAQYYILSQGPKTPCFYLPHSFLPMDYRLLLFRLSAFACKLIFTSTLNHWTVHVCLVVWIWVLSLVPCVAWQVYEVAAAEKELEAPDATWRREEREETQELDKEGWMKGTKGWIFNCYWNYWLKFWSYISHTSWLRSSLREPGCRKDGGHQPLLTSRDAHKSLRGKSKSSLKSLS